MFVVLLLPDFRLQSALRHRDELRTRPAALVDDEAVLEINSAAADAGVTAGMPSVQALARCPQLALLPRSAASEQVVQAALTEAAFSLSPNVEATAGGCCTVDVMRTLLSAEPPPSHARGQACPRHDDWHTLAGKVVAHLTALGLRAQLGVAPNPDLAFLAARRAQPVLVVQSPTAFLSQLAVAEIEPSRELLAVLHDWGIQTLGQLTALPRGELGNRLGPEADQLWQRAAGQTERPLRLVRHAEQFDEAFDFEREIETLEPLLFILRRFLDSLALRLGNAHRVAARLTLTLPLENGACHERQFTIPAPSADADVLFRILHTHLEALQLDHRPVAARLHADAIHPDHRQLHLFENPLRDANRFGETLARIASIVGAGNVGTPEILDTHRPDSFRIIEPQFHRSRRREEADRLESGERHAETGKSDAGRHPLRVPSSALRTLISPPPHVVGYGLGLPLRRFRPPFPAQVQLVHHQPAYVASEKINGRVMDALGPYRLSGDWWEDARWSGEEWDIELADHSLWRLVRNGDNWLLEGCYDISEDAGQPRGIMPMNPTPARS